MDKRTVLNGLGIAFAGSIVGPFVLVQFGWVFASLVALLLTLVGLAVVSRGL